MEFGGTVAVVTGASSGIGRACAVALLERGARAVMTGRDAGALRALANAYPKQAHWLAGDIAEPSFCDRLFEDAKARFGGYDLVINNAGIMTSGPIQTIQLDRVAEMVRVNVQAAFRVMYTAVRHFQSTGRGDLVNVSSSIAGRPMAEAGAYSGTKAAVDALAASLRAELARTDIRITTLSPGLVETQLHREYDVPFKIVRGISEPLMPDDIAGTLLFALAQPRHVRFPQLVIVPGDSGQ